jgi:hypothetical protein
MVMNKTARDRGASRIVRSAERVFPEHASKELGRGRLEERATKKDGFVRIMNMWKTLHG